MQFRVPQFIDVEDKVVGPFTIKQFGYVIGGIGLSFLIWTFISVKFIAILLIVIVMALFLSLAFVKFNNRPFGDLLESAFSYYSNSKVYTWKQPQEKKTEASTLNKKLAETEKKEVISKINRDRIHDLSLGLDVYDKQKPVADDNTLENK